MAPALPTPFSARPISLLRRREATMPWVGRRGSFGAGATWQELPAPPASTAAVAFSGTGRSARVDALVVHGSTPTDGALRLRSCGWVRPQTIEVPITCGSSG